MEKQTVFIKRLPSKGELPKYHKVYKTDLGEKIFSINTNSFMSSFGMGCINPDYWLEEIELPSEEEVCKGLDSSYKEWQDKGVVSNINESAAYKAGLVDTRKFIINHLKSNTNERKA